MNADEQLRRIAEGKDRLAGLRARMDQIMAARKDRVPTEPEDPEPERDHDPRP